jgi:hypothetical protein
LFEYWLLRGIFMAKRDGIIGEWRNLHNEELNDLYCSPNIVRVMESRIMRLARHVALTEEGRDVNKLLVGKPEGKRPLGDQDVGGKIILRWILRNWFRCCGDWMELAQDRDSCRALVSTVTNCGAP